MALILTLNISPAFAAEHTICLAELIPTSSNSDYISVKTTVHGDIGFAAIRWINGGKIYWAITPKSISITNPLIFIGKITIIDINTNKTVKTLSVGGEGQGVLDGNKYFSGLKRKHDYQAVLTGGGTYGVFPYAVSEGCWENYYIE